MNVAIYLGQAKVNAPDHTHILWAECRLIHEDHQIMVSTKCLKVWKADLDIFLSTMTHELFSDLKTILLGYGLDEYIINTAIDAYFKKGKT